MRAIGHRRRTAVAAVLGLLIIAGCGYQAPTHPDRAALSGTVYFRGEILPGGDVTIVSENDPGLVSVASIKQDGTFRATDAPKGKVLIAVTTDSMRYGRNPESYVEIPRKYHDPATSGLFAEVTLGEDSSVDLKLE